MYSTLSGGVIISTSADMLHKSYFAFILGFFMGIISSWMIDGLPKFLVNFKIQEVSKVLSLHGVTGILAGLFGAIFR